MKKAIIFLFLMAGVGAMANNLQINNVALTDNDPVAKTVMIRFDISWDHSWRDEINWDAAWVFAKFFDGELPYHHCKLSLEGSLCGTGTPHELIVPNDSLQLEGMYYGVGAFIYRNALSDGTFAADSVKLKWNYSLNGFDTLPADIEVHVYGTEMVYIPEGPFAFGDGDGTSSSGWHLKDSPDYLYVGDYLAPLMINSAGDEQVSITGIRVHGKDGLDWDGDGDIDNPNFPTGYKAFYMMKYETTQGQYTDFLNALTPNQITGCNLFETTLQYRYSISLQDGKYGCARPDRACNFFNGGRPISYADWAGMRPMTALEFEKAVRGPINAVNSEYAWGNINSVSLNEIAGEENGTEIPLTENANYHGNINLTGGDGGDGPVRAGIFARENSARELSGSGYYGVMELSGNLAEIMIEMLSYSSSYLGSFRGFHCDHGDGEISNNGHANSFRYLLQNGFNPIFYIDNSSRFDCVSRYSQYGYLFCGARFVRNAPILP